MLYVTKLQIFIPLKSKVYIVDRKFQHGPLPAIHKTRHTLALMTTYCDISKIKKKINEQDDKIN